MQFGLRSLLLVMLVSGVAAAGLGGLLRAARSDTGGEALLPFVLLTVAAPLAVLLIASATYAVSDLLKKHKH